MALFTVQYCVLMQRINQVIWGLSVEAAPALLNDLYVIDEPMGQKYIFPKKYTTYLLPHDRRCWGSFILNLALCVPSPLRLMVAELSS